MTSIAFTGDISFSKYMTDSWKKDDLLDEQVTAFLHSADHVVANVECTLSNTPTTSGGLKHSSDPRAGAYVRDKVGSKIWTLANNHILDSKAPGLLDTLAVAKECGCQTMGAGVNKADAAKPVYLDVEGGIGIFSVVYDISTLRTEENEPGVLIWTETERIQKTINEIKAKCRWCVMVVHGQRCEFTQMPLPAARRRMISFLDMGADVIVGHHPHVVQNYEKIGEKMIFYSLGNFIFDTDYQRIQNYTDCGMLLKLNFTENDWTWESQPIRIDREHNRIVAGENPVIFTHVGEEEYNLLSDLTYADFMVTDRRSRMYINSVKYGAFTEEQWFTYDAERMTEQGAKDLREANDRAKLGAWKQARAELVAYIGKDLDFVK